MASNHALRRVLVACAATLAFALATASSAEAIVVPGAAPVTTAAPQCLLPDGTPGLVLVPNGPCTPPPGVSVPGVGPTTVPGVGTTVPGVGSLPGVGPTTQTLPGVGGLTGTPGTGGGSTPTGAGGQPDTTGPKARLAARKARLSLALRRGYTVTVACDEACGIDGRLSNAGRWSDIARGRARLSGPGTAKLKLRFTGKARRTLKRQRSVRLTIRVIATDAAGNTTTRRKRVTLKR